MVLWCYAEQVGAIVSLLNFMIPAREVTQPTPLL